MFVIPSEKNNMFVNCRSIKSVVFCDEDTETVVKVFYNTESDASIKVNVVVNKVISVDDRFDYVQKIYSAENKFKYISKEILESYLNQ